MGENKQGHSEVVLLEQHEIEYINPIFSAYAIAISFFFFCTVLLCILATAS